MPDPGNGAFICTGALINNTAEDKTPYFLSANHCYERTVGTANPANFSMRFNWISPNPVCAATTASTDAIDNFTISSSTFRARNADSDVLLVEINNPIPVSWDVTYAGWDKTDTNPSFEVGIHHPSGDIMKVSRDDDGATKTTSDGTDVWLIGGTSAGSGNGWEIGVTEGGSSGSPLFDQNGRVIGQLFGGQAACSGTVTANLSTTDNAVLDEIQTNGDNIQTKLDTIDSQIDLLEGANTIKDVSWLSSVSLSASSLSANLDTEGYKELTLYGKTTANHASNLHIFGSSGDGTYYHISTLATSTVGGTHYIKEDTPLNLPNPRYFKIYNADTSTATITLRATLTDKRRYV